MHGSPVSTTRIFSNRSKKRLNNNTNTGTTNISFCNSVSGMFKNSVIGTQGDGSSKYCAACKFKEWKKKQLCYDLDMFIRNRDMIRSVQCLGCDIQFEVKYFLDHVKSCRLCYNIPSMVSKEDLIAKMSYDNHKYMTNRKGVRSPSTSLLKENSNVPTPQKQHEF